MQSVPSPEIGNIVERNRSYAQALTAQILRGLPAGADRPEIHAAAELGLVEAASNYDARNGVPFQTFAYYRIRGAVYDCLRMNHPLTAERGTNDYLRDYAEVPNPRLDATGAGRELERITGSAVCSYLLSLEPLDAGVAAAIADLPPDNRQVMEQYYYSDLSLEQIGEKLHRSKSWVCRNHAKSLEMLSERLQVKARAAARAKARKSI